MSLNLTSLNQKGFQTFEQKLPGRKFKTYGTVDHGNVTYAITGRSYDTLQSEVYPTSYLNDLTPDMCILDIGAGDGSFVEDLRKRGFSKAEGIDINEILPKNKPYFKHMGIEDADYPADTFDRMFSSYSVFYYEEPPRFLKKALDKMTQMLKPGGKIRLAPLESLEDLKAIVREVPGLKVTDEGPDDSRIELTKGILMPIFQKETTF